jgi:hypothetical protein
MQKDSKKYDWISGVVRGNHALVSAVRIHNLLLLKDTRGDRASGRARVMLFSRQRAARYRRLKGDVIHFEKVALRLQPSSPYESSIRLVF